MATNWRQWRVHVGIKLVRAQMGLDRWNEDRADKPADYNVSKHEPKVEAPVATETEPTETEKPKRGRKPKKTDEE